MAAALDYKKTLRELYGPGTTPSILTVPPANYAAVRGRGDPNREDGEYKQAVGLLFAVSYTIKTSRLGAEVPPGYFNYVVPPLEGLWWQEGTDGIDYSRKEAFCWISMIRLPDFVTKEEFDWAVNEATEKKQSDFSKVQFFPYKEGLCVQCMHIGIYDDEPETIQKMNSFIQQNGYVDDFSEMRLHHEIYLSDPRRTAPEKLRTVIRHPIRPAIAPK